MEKALSPDMLATDLAYYLVRKGVSIEDILMESVMVGFEATMTHWDVLSSLDTKTVGLSSPLDNIP